MNTLLRILACLLSIASPSRVELVMFGFAAEPRTWLDRWERRIDERVAARMAEFVRTLPPMGPWPLAEFADDEDDEDKKGDES